jgi:hypothetical protein
MGKNYNPNMDYFPFACGALQKMKLLLGGGPDLRITLTQIVGTFITSIVKHRRPS